MPDFLGILVSIKENTVIQTVGENTLLKNDQRGKLLWIYRH